MCAFVTEIRILVECGIIDFNSDILEFAPMLLLKETIRVYNTDSLYDIFKSTILIGHLLVLIRELLNVP